MPYVNPRSRRRGSKVRFAQRAVGGYYAVGDLSSDLRSTASTGLAQLQAGAQNKAAGFATSLLNSAGGALSSIFGGGSKPAAPSSGMMTGGPRFANYGAAVAAQQQAQAGGDDTIFGLPKIAVIAGGVGVAALLILRKKH